jgi:multifunctional 2-oxoglutarate metabolism enzyme
MSSVTAALLSRIRTWIARATSSRGASSSTKRSPVTSSRRAPSPRMASVTRNPSASPVPATAVGWNWTSSRSARAAPAAAASVSPFPVAPSGFVVRAHSAAAPPVARTTARAGTVGPSSHPSPTQRPSTHRSAVARVFSSTVIRSCSATQAESWRVTRRPVALPPAWAIRRSE